MYTCVIHTFGYISRHFIVHYQAHANDTANGYRCSEVVVIFRPE